MRNRDPACPFCGQRLRETSAWPAVVGLIAAAGCGPAVDVPGDSDAATSTTTATGPVSTTMTTEEPPSTMPPSSGPMVTTSVSTTGIDSTTDGSTTESFSSVGFIYGVPTTGGDPWECDVWEQDCPDGEQCNPWANDGGNQWNATRCTPLDPDPAAPGEACAVEGSHVSGVENCDASSLCFFVDHTVNMGTCMERCSGSENNPICADPDMTCAITNDGTINLCLPICDPLSSTCQEGASCLNNGGGDFFCFPDHSGDGGGYGDACDYFNECDPGFFCAVDDHVPGCADPACCSSFCDVNSPTCEDGQECLNWYEDAPLGYEDVGGCGVP